MARFLSLRVGGWGWGDFWMASFLLPPPSMGKVCDPLFAYYIVYDPLSTEYWPSMIHSLLTVPAVIHSQRTVYHPLSTVIHSLLIMTVCYLASLYWSPMILSLLTVYDPRSLYWPSVIHSLLTVYDPLSTDRLWSTLYWPSVIHSLLTVYDPLSTNRLWSTLYRPSVVHSLLWSPLFTVIHSLLWSTLYRPSMIHSLLWSPLSTVIHSTVIHSLPTVCDPLSTVIPTLYCDPLSTDRLWSTLYRPSMIHSLLWSTLYWPSMIHSLPTVLHDKNVLFMLYCTISYTKRIWRSYTSCNTLILKLHVCTIFRNARSTVRKCKKQICFTFLNKFLNFRSKGNSSRWEDVSKFPFSVSPTLSKKVILCSRKIKVCRRRMAATGHLICTVNSHWFTSRFVRLYRQILFTKMFDWKRPAVTS